jgi:transcriptional regulator with XRE-family HTH domain
MKRTSPRRNARPRLPKVHGKIGIRRTDDEFAFDKQIAAQLLAGRVMRDVSQAMLATKIGVSFQQIQKYETAKNRISASRLLRIARALDLPPAWFFDGIPGDAAANDQGLPASLALVGRISRLPKREQHILERVLDGLEQPCSGHEE